MKPMSSLILGAPFDGWLSPLDDVPDAVFAQRLLGDGLAIDPLDATLHAPADATVVSVHAAGHAVTLRFAGGVEALMHIGLETVRLGGEGFTAHVRAGDRVAAGDRLISVDLAHVAPRVKSLITPLVLTETAGHAIVQRAAAGRVTLGAPLLVLAPEQAAASAGPGEFAATARTTLRIPLAHGLHARPAARLAELARTFDAEVRIVPEATPQAAPVRLRSPSAVMALGLRHGDAMALLASGPAAQAAIDALAELIATGMGEGRPLPETAPAPVVVTPNEPAVAAPAALQPGERLHAVTAAAGYAIGAAAWLERPEPPRAAHGQGADAESTRFARALQTLGTDLDRRAQADASGEQAAILAAHRLLLDDEDILADVHAGIARGQSASLAWQHTMETRAAALRAAPDPHIAQRAADFIDLEWQLQWHLAGQEPPAATLPANAIIIAPDLVPSQVAALPVGQVAGIVTAQGGPTSHVAIIAASKGIPALVAAGPRVLDIAPGTPLLLDATGAMLTVSPDAPTWAAAQAEAARRQARKAAAQAASGLEGRTRDGQRIEVCANLGKRAEAAPAVAAGAEGCGLLRTEFLFLDRASAPDEDEQADDYSAIAHALDGRPLIIRLLDIGGDKPAPYLPMAAEENPALGLRGIRVGLARRDVLVPQLRAVLRAGAVGDVRVMAPMIARVEELRAVRAALDGEAASLGLPTVPLGVMVETPAAAVMADALAAECDFLSIGTNDLTQYALAMDRGNPAVAGSIDGLDPAVLRLVGLCCQGAAAHGKWVGVCGGLASDPLAVPILIGLGVTELSAAPAMVPEIKALVRALSAQDCRALAEQVLGVATAAQVRVLAAQMIEGVAL
ncbi:phosphoenolpyruvate--protein phosphotransferase [Novosphingobium rhizosphaerae]|uniref:phosphoenolpyruvate--protein phosphotransferase n=1 Tax=Novosphingobium rhizosphaerae TaxID=1551649 RepID=UPI0017E44B4A